MQPANPTNRNQQKNTKMAPSGMRSRAVRSAMVMSPEARARIQAEQDALIENFIRERGVTYCPPSYASGSHSSKVFGSDL